MAAAGVAVRPGTATWMVLVTAISSSASSSSSIFSATVSSSFFASGSSGGWQIASDAGFTSLSGYTVNSVGSRSTFFSAASISRCDDDVADAPRSGAVSSVASYSLSTISSAIGVVAVSGIL